jgi:hypothetical protein
VGFGKCTFDKDGKDEPKDHGTGDLQDKCKARVIAVAPKDEGFVCGMKDGTIRVFDNGVK